MRSPVATYFYLNISCFWLFKDFNPDNQERQDNLEHQEMMDYQDNLEHPALQQAVHRLSTVSVNPLLNVLSSK